MSKRWHTTVNKAVKAEIIRQGDEIEIGPRIPTGSLSLDVELGGGWASGKINTISGNESSGKTAIILKTVAEFQKKWPDKEVVWIDVEDAWDPTWVKTLGVDPSKVTVVVPQYSEQGFDIAEKAVEEGAGLISIDSLTAMTPKAEAEADMEQVLVGLQARLNSKFFRKAGAALGDKRDVLEKPTFLMIQQIRENVGGYGNPEVEPGGRAVKFHSSIRVRIQKGDLYPASKKKTDEGVQPKAQAIHFHVIKNKTAPAFRRGHFWFYFDTLDKYRPKGCYDRLEEIIRYAIKYRVVEKSGKWHYIPDPNTGEVISFDGSAKLASYIRENEKVSNWITEEVMRKATSEEEIETETTIPEDEQGEGKDSGKPTIELIDNGEGETSLEELASKTTA